MISSPHLSTTLIYDVPQWWSLYLNRCVAVLESEALEAPGDNVPFTLDPILLELEVGRYVRPVLPGTLSDILVGRRPVGSSGSRGGGSVVKGINCGNGFWIS